MLRDLLLITFLFSGLTAQAKKTDLTFVPLAQAHPPKFLLKEKKAADAVAAKEGGGTVEATVAWIDLNNDKKKDFCVSYTTNQQVKNANIRCFVAKSKTKFVKVVDVLASAEFVSLPGTKTKGYWDLIFSGSGFDKHRIWKWNGKEYR